MTANIVSIPAYECRGITWLESGKQVVCSLPAGDYDVMGEQEVEYSDLGRLHRNVGVLLVNVATAERWFVGVQVAAHLVAEFKA